VGRIGAAR